MQRLTAGNTKHRKNRGFKNRLIFCPHRMPKLTSNYKVDNYKGKYSKEVNDQTFGKQQLEHGITKKSQESNPIKRGSTTFLSHHLQLIDRQVHVELQNRPRWTLLLPFQFEVSLPVPLLLNTVVEINWFAIYK